MFDSEYGDRRKEIRIIVQAMVDCKYRGAAVSKVFSSEGFVHSLSIGGISFRTRVALPDITFLNMKINLPLVGKIIKPTIEILWKNNNKKLYGGRISKISGPDLKYLKEFIENPSTTKRILMDRRMQNDILKAPQAIDRRKKRTKGNINGC